MDDLETFDDMPFPTAATPEPPEPLVLPAIQTRDLTPAVGAAGALLLPTLGTAMLAEEVSVRIAAIVVAGVVAVALVARETFAVRSRNARVATVQTQLVGAAADQGRRIDAA